MEIPCPLCGRDKYMRKGKPLYGQRACKKCYNGFANRRQLAFIIDTVLYRVGVVVVGVAFGFALLALHVDPEKIGYFSFPLDLALVGLFLCKDGFGGQSPGKMACGVTAIDRRTGVPISPGASFKRNLPLVVCFMPLVVGVQLCKGQRTGDGWAFSKVIWNKYAEHPIFAVGNQASDAGVATEAAQKALLDRLAAMPPADDGNPYQAPRL